MLFLVKNHAHNNATFTSNREATQRQTDALRSKIFKKWERKIGKDPTVRNLNSARRKAQQELKTIPQYWDGDETPRRVIKPSSSAVASIRPYAGAVFVAFKSNPSKEYYYPKGMGTTESAAIGAEKLVTADSIGKAINGTWGKAHALKKKVLKSGNIQYSGKIVSLKSLTNKVHKK